MADLIKVGIADDHSLVRQGIVELINAFEGMEVTVEGEDGKDLIEKMKGDVPNVILLDIEMPRMDGYDTAAWIKKHYPKVFILGLSQHNTDHYIAHFIEQGGVGYLLKNVSADDLEDSIRRTVKQGYCINNNVSFKMLTGFTKRYKYKPGFKKSVFTEAEKEILLQICKGKSSIDIAKEMSKSARTVENHRSNMIEKLGVQNSIQLVVEALKQEVIVLEELH
jgi:DNA-binding NarL/FixJ family response regulator